MPAAPPPPIEPGDAETVAAPVGWVRTVSELRLPERTDRRLTELMDRNTEGTLTPAERDELASLVEMSETLALIRADAFGLLGSAPG